jgi:nucleoside-diphosphate-sugar epimerase
MIAITGSTGFVGNNLSKYLQNCKMAVENISRQSLSDLNFRLSGKVDTVVHLAGKAHDLKKIADPSEYYIVNTELTKVIFDKFLESNASIFITISSVKAAADVLNAALTEDHIPNPITHYGKSKLLAEKYILSNQIPAGKRIYILRPCMIHGPGNKGNLNLLYKMVSKGLPWPLGSFGNKRSFCSIDNICFIINELIKNDKIPSGIYNVADDEAISTNEIIRLIADGQGKKSYILKIPKFIIILLTKLGDIFKLPLNTERLNKLTETYIVSNKKIKLAINKSLPVTAKDGLMKTLNSFGKSNMH